MIGGGFGPSTGRVVEVCESSEARFRRATRSDPPITAVYALVALFLGGVSGMTLLYENERILGAVVLVATAAAVVLLVIWTWRTRE